MAAVLVGAGLAGCQDAPIDALTLDPSSLSRDLVAHWTFDAMDEMTVADSSGNGYHGTVTGGSWISSGHFGGALSLASGDFVAVPGFPQANASWTVSVWIRSSAADLAASTTDWSTILSNEIQYSGGWEIHLDNRAENHPFNAAYFAAANIKDYQRVVCNCIEPGRWIHLTTVWDGTKETMTLFRDAQPVDQIAMPSPIQTGDTTLYAGRWSQPGRHLAADIDDFAVWRRALQPAEIARLSYQSPGR